MAFPRKLLNDHEDIVLDLKPHWWFMSRPIIAVLLGVTASVILMLNLEGDLSFAALVPLALTVICVIWLVVRFLQWNTTNFVVTTDRLIHRYGVLAKHGREIPLERVNDIAFSQGIFERLLRSGDLVIESGGERGQQSFSNIARPSLVQNQIYAQIEAAHARDADRRSGRRELSIPEQIEKLDELRQRGVVSNAEFQMQKTKLLDRL
ncbi:MAG TPA: PH domain-containing protein [Acidimicrobiales bacterium]|nr:PH domain-containing protein [Acidimicrobiales bacterium]